VDRRISWISWISVGCAQADAEQEACADGRADESIAHVLKDRRPDEASPSFQVWFRPEDDSVRKEC
jgi:hypothetical protein